MEHHDDGKTMIIELKKDAVEKQKEEELTLTHSSIFPVKAKYASRNPILLVVIILLLLSVAVFLILSSLGHPGGQPEETTPTKTDPTLDPSHSFSVSGLAEAEDATYAVKSGFALLIEADSLHALAAKNANEKMYPASMTKIMTFLVAYDCLKDDLDKKLVLSQDIRNQYAEGSRIGIDVNDLLTVEQCMYAMLLESDTDAVLMLVREAAGNEAAFAERMNEKAEELGLTATHFTNANGLHDNEHYTTPAEMAVIFAKALENELFHTIVTTHTYVTHLWFYSNGQEKSYRMTFFNRTLVDRFEKNGIATELSSGLEIVGGKTGFTDEAKNCQAALAVDELGKQYIAILGHASSGAQSAKDTAKLFNQYAK